MGSVGGGTVTNVTAASAEDRRGWHREVVESVRWLEAGYPTGERWRADLHPVLGPGRCLGCGNPAATERRWCEAYRTGHAERMRLQYERRRQV